MFPRSLEGNNEWLTTHQCFLSHRIWCLVFMCFFMEKMQILGAFALQNASLSMGFVEVKSFQLLGWWFVKWWDPADPKNTGSVPVSWRECVWFFEANIFKSKRTDWTISVESLTSKRSVRVLVVVIDEGYTESNLIEVDYFSSNIDFVIGFTFAVYLVCWYLNQAFWHVLGF